MVEKNEILDFLTIDLTSQEGKLTIVREDDHLLRRFGQVDVLSLSSDQEIELKRIKADEIWALFSGTAQLKIQDEREESPNFGSIVNLELNQNDPKAILIPFGTRCRFRAKSQAIFLRVTTHQDGFDAGDQFILG